MKLLLSVLAAIAMSTTVAIAQKKADEKFTITNKEPSATVTLDAGILGSGKKGLEVTLNTVSVVTTLRQAGITTVGHLAKANPEALARAISKSSGHTSATQKKRTTLKEIHPRAAIELAARLKATAESVVMSGGSTMFEGVKGDTGFNPLIAGRMFLNPSRTYKQLPDKFNMK
ncbi:MAG: hypothetical protein ACE366_00710 [Bradymonadia bacterium]